MVFLALVIIFAGQLVSVISLKNKERALAAEIERKKSEEIIAGQELEYYRTDKFIEQYAREVLGLVKEGEEIFEIDG